MIVEPAGIPGLLIVRPTVHRDPRGHLFEGWRAAEYAEHGIGPFVQDNVSKSAVGVLRGLHFQYPGAQGKLLTVLHGRVFDVAVDVRNGSPTFGRWAGLELSADTGVQFWVPAGFAHGFVALSEGAVLQYKCTEYYKPATEHVIRWNDPAIKIEWPIPAPTLSSKDAAAPLLSELPLDALPRYADGG